MERVVRAVPVTSRKALLELVEEAAAKPAPERAQFLAHFGGAIEEWYYQEIEGKPYIIAIAEGEKLNEGFAKYPDLDDPFFNWLRDRVLELSGVDLRAIPKAAQSELVYRLSA